MKSFTILFLAIFTSLVTYVTAAPISLVQLISSCSSEISSKLLDSRNSLTNPNWASLSTNSEIIKRKLIIAFGRPYRIFGGAIAVPFIQVFTPDEQRSGAMNETIASMNSTGNLSTMFMNGSVATMDASLMTASISSVVAEATATAAPVNVTSA